MRADLKVVQRATRGHCLNARLSMDCLQRAFAKYTTPDDRLAGDHQDWVLVANARAV
jgi:hypothetical protein